MKDTIFNGQKKNNLHYHTNRRTQINKKKFNMHLPTNLLCSSTAALRTCILNKNNSLTSLQYQPMFYHISNIRAINRIGPQNEDVISVIIGSTIGDGYLHKRSGEGVRVCYRQSNIHKEYLMWLYEFYYSRGYTSNLQPRQYTRTLRSKEGKVYYGYEFNTFTFRSFSWIHEMFYHKGKKVIPLNIFEYLTPLALAVLVMDDGGWTNYGVKIATNSFELKEV